MKLSDLHVALRIKFREKVINAWFSEKQKYFFGIFGEMAEEVGTTPDEIRKALAEIPSIGFIHFDWQIRPWLARHYPKVSDALFDRGDRQIAMTLFVTKNHVTDKRSVIKNVAASVRRNTRKIDAIRTLNSEKGDRWAKTSWKVCK